MKAKYKINLVLILSVLLFSACTNQADAKRALESESYTEIQYTGYNWFSCSDNDFYHTGFKAKNSQGKTVEGTVCSGVLFKSATIRY